MHLIQNTDSLQDRVRMAHAVQRAFGRNYNPCGVTASTFNGRWSVDTFDKDTGECFQILPCKNRTTALMAVGLVSRILGLPVDTTA